MPHTFDTITVTESGTVVYDHTGQAGAEILLKAGTHNTALVYVGAQPDAGWPLRPGETLPVTFTTRDTLTVWSGRGPQTVHVAGGGAGR